MIIIPKPSTVKEPAGTVHRRRVVRPHRQPQNDDQRAVVSMVRFSPGARTAWHSHARGQTLHIIEGVALIGSLDGTIIEAKPGQTIYTPPGEEHWHGATPEDFMQHLACMELGDDPATTSIWLEHVADADYHRP